MSYVLGIGGSSLAPFVEGAQLTIHFNNTCFWFSVRVLGVENLANFPDVFSRVLYVHLFRTV